MSRYRRQQTPGDNLRELYGKLMQGISAALGDSAIDDDDGALEVRVDESPVALVGHADGKHGLLVPDGGGWRTVQEDAQARASAAAAAAQTAAVAAAKTYTDSAVDSAVTGGIAGIGSDLEDLKDEVHAARGGYSNLDARLDNLNARINALEL